MFNIPFRCYDCKSNLIAHNGEGRSVKLKCECILGWCQDCARNCLLKHNKRSVDITDEYSSVISTRSKIIGEKSYLVCPICEDRVNANDIIVQEKENENARIRITENFKFKHNIFLENCIREELTGECEIERNCLSCQDSLVEGNTVQQFCACTNSLCQLCVREHISRNPFTYCDGSYICPTCRFKTPNLQNVKEAKSKEDEILKTASMYFTRGRTAKVNLKLRQNLVLLWAGVVYVNNSQIEALDTVRRNHKEKVSIRELLLYLEAEVKAPLKPLLEFTLNADEASDDMLRLDITRLFLWRTRGGPVMPFGPLAILTIPRNRLLERWAHKKLDEFRDSNGAMGIVSTSDYYSVTVQDRNKTVIVGKTIEMRLIFAVQVAQKKVVEKEEAYLSTYCQGSIRSVIPAKMNCTAPVHQPVIEVTIEEDDKEEEEEDEDDEKVITAYFEEDVDAFRGEINQSGDQFVGINDTDYEPTVVDFSYDNYAAEDFDDADQDYVEQWSPHAAPMSEDYGAGDDATTTAAEEWTNHMIVESDPVTLSNTATTYSESLAESSSSSITHSLAHSISSQSPKTAETSAEESDSSRGGTVEQTIDVEVMDEQSSLGFSTGQLGDRPSPPPVVVPPARKSLLQSFAHSRGWNSLKRTSVVCLDHRMESPSSSSVGDLKRSKLTNVPTVSATSLVSSMKRQQEVHEVNSNVTSIVSSSSPSFASSSSSSSSILSPTSSTGVRNTTATRNPMASQLDDSDVTAAMVLNTRATISEPAVIPLTANANATAEPKPKVKKSVTFKEILEEFEPVRLRVSRNRNGRDVENLLHYIQQQSIWASDDLRYQYRNDVLYPEIRERLSPINLENALRKAVRESKDYNSFNTRDAAKFEADCAKVIDKYELDILNELNSRVDAEAKPKPDNEQVVQVPNYVRFQRQELSVDKLFESLDFSKLGSFALFVVTPLSKDLKSDASFLLENNNSSNNFYPVEFVMPPRAVTSLGLQPRYHAKLKIASAQLQVVSIINQLSFQLKFTGKVNHIRSSVDNHLYLQKTKTIAFYNIPKGSKIELRPIEEQRKFFFHRRRPDRPTPKEDADLHAKQLMLKEMKDGGSQHAPRPHHSAPVHTGDDSTDDDDDSNEEGTRKSSKKRGIQRKGLQRPNQQKGGAGRPPPHPYQNQQRPNHPPPRPPPPPAPPAQPPQKPQQQPPQYPPQPYQQQRHGGRDSGDRNRDRDDHDRHREGDRGRDDRDRFREGDRGRDDRDRHREGDGGRGRDDRDRNRDRDRNDHRDRGGNRDGSDRRDGNNGHHRYHNGNGRGGGYNHN